MKILYCPVCKGKLTRDDEADDEAEDSNYHDFVGHNYICARGHALVIFAEKPF